MRSANVDDQPLVEVLDKADRGSHLLFLTQINHMKMRHVLLTLLAFVSLIALPARAASMDKTIATINADAQKEGGPDRVLRSISASTKVPVATLAKQKANSGLSYGDLYAAHAIAKPAGKSFDQIAALKTKGQTWDMIADANNVSLGGKAAAGKAVANATPSPSPAARTLDQERRGRMSAEHEVTNAPRPKKP